jgi:hypothetical protein
MPSFQAQLRHRELLDRGGAARNAALVLGSSLALWASAKLQIPFYPVPMTLQSLVVLAIGMGLGARLGAAAVALYLLEGALGLPVFAGTPAHGIGLVYMMGRRAAISSDTCWLPRLWAFSRIADGGVASLRVSPPC